MTRPFEPMLAAKGERIEDITLPALASPKLDGIRCVIVDGVPLSRKLKPIPNRHICAMLAGLPPLDGELICGAETGADVMNRSASGVMSVEGEPDFTFHVFDWFGQPELPFSDRFDVAALIVDTLPEHLRAIVKVVPHQPAYTTADLAFQERECVAAGYEGIMLRDPAGRYKFGRSTLRDRGLVKWKRRQDAEAVVTGTVERFHNGNVAKTNAVGKTERSTAKAGKVPTGTLGALICDIGGVSFEIGSGFTDAQRAELWAQRESLPGQHVTFLFQELTPAGVPRFPVFKAFRHADDMGAMLS